MLREQQDPFCQPPLPQGGNQAIIGRVRLHPLAGILWPAIVANSERGRIIEQTSQADPCLRQGLESLASKDLPDRARRHIVTETPAMARKVEFIDRTLELRWLREHRCEYAGKWVAVKGDRLIASGDDARSVFEAASRSSISRPLVVQIEPPDAAPFGGW